jgi:CheY-like chemotaxis protein
MLMPRMNGWEFCRALDRTGEARPAIVVVTAAADAAARAAEVSADAWLSKPFDIADLLRTVREHLAKRAT